MCAIFGIVGEYDLGRARKALASMHHRGPDGQGEIVRPGLYLGHRRLHILDASATQPVVDGKRMALLNGEIYNYQELGAANDTEVLLLAPLAKLEGMYAIAMVEDGTLTLAKDPFGKKPLYYYQDPERFIFASEIKAIETYLGGLAYNDEALGGYLSYGALPNRLTWYKGLFKLLGGEILRLDLATRSYTLERKSLPQPASDDLEEAISRSIVQRLQGDFDVAALLSGGVDSSLVAALAKQAQGRLATYTIGYEERRYSELPYAREVARHIGSDHHEVIMGEEEFWQALDEVFAHFDEPVGDSATIPLWYLFGRIARDGWRVVLSGEGGDELFLGYRHYFEFADLYKARDLRYKNWLRNYLRANFSPNREWEWYKRAFGGEVIFRGSNEIFTDLQKNLFLRRNVRDGESLEYLQDLLAELDESDIFTFFTRIDLRTRLEALYLPKLDMSSMAHSIEARTPLLDSRILAAALADPERAAAPKISLKRVAAKYLPRTIIERKKRGFSYPWMEWLARSDTQRELVKINDEAGFFKPQQLRFLIQNARRNRFVRHYWLVFAFLVWFRRRYL